MTQQTNGMPELKYSEEAFRAMYEALKGLVNIFDKELPDGSIGRIRCDKGIRALALAENKGGE